MEIQKFLSERKKVKANNKDYMLWAVFKPSFEIFSAVFFMNLLVMLKRSRSLNTLTYNYYLVYLNRAMITVIAPFYIGNSLRQSTEDLIDSSKYIRIIDEEEKPLTKPSIDITDTEDNTSLI